MELNRKLIKVGRVFFNYRSSIPLGLVILMILERKHFYAFKSPYFKDFVFESVCFAAAFLGFIIRAYTVGHCQFGTSGRNTKGQYADSLNTDGMYSIVRNPIYVGNFFIILGISMLSQSYEVVFINLLLFIIFYIPVILLEEDFLLDKFKDAFIEYAKQTPALVPNFKLWRKPELKFNIARFLARENDSFFGVIWAFFLIEILRDYTLENKISFDAGWVAIMGFCSTLWVILKSMRRYLKSIDKDQRYVVSGQHIT